jgi:hypothetical protein
MWQAKKAFRGRKVKRIVSESRAEMTRRPRPRTRHRKTCQRGVNGASSTGAASGVGEPCVGDMKLTSELAFPSQGRVRSLERRLWGQPDSKANGNPRVIIVLRT